MSIFWLVWVARPRSNPSNTSSDSITRGLKKCSASCSVLFCWRKLSGKLKHEDHAYFAAFAFLTAGFISGVSQRLPQLSLHQRIQETQRSGGGFVADRRLVIGIIVTAVTIPHSKTDGTSVSSTQQDGQPFLVRDMLNLCDHDAPGFLVQNLVRPVRIQSGKFVGDAIVLAMPNCVNHS